MATLIKKKTNALLILLNAKLPEVNPHPQPLVPDLNVSLGPVLSQGSNEAAGFAQIPPTVDKGTVQE